MLRRDFFGLVGSALTVVPLRVLAQQGALPVIGFLNGGVASAADRYRTAFLKGLSETGYVDGRNVTVEFYWMEGQFDRVPALLADLVRRQVAVIATPGFTAGTLAAKAAITKIPIVFGVAEDPVKLGLVESLARPGANATGISFFGFEVASKQLGLLHELAPSAARLAVLLNPNTSISADVTLQPVQEAARRLGLQQTIVTKASTAAEIDAAFAEMARQRADALFIQADGFFVSRSAQLAALATSYRLPASNFSRQMAQAGLLMSYGTDIADMFRQVGIYAGNVLGGAKPADLPVIQPTRFEFVINLRAAKLLGLEISPMLLARADEVIE